MKNLCDSLIKDSIVCGIVSDSGQVSLRETNLRFACAVDICHADELTVKELGEMEKHMHTLRHKHTFSTHPDM